MTVTETKAAAPLLNAAPTWQVPFALLACASSRVAVFVAGVWWVARHGYQPVSSVIRDPRFAEALHGLAGRLVNPWAHWDGVWFVRIASTGYRHPDSQAFFPLYPLLVHLLAPLVGGYYVIAGMIVSLVAFAVTMVLLYKLSSRLFDPSVAAWTVAFIAWFPTSFVFSAVYSESLFLMLCVAAFWFASTRRWLVAGIAGFFAALTRNSGVLLVVPLLLLYGREVGWSWRSLSLRWPRDLRLASLLLLPAGLLVYMAYLKAEFGNALMFSTVERHWHRHLGDPIGTIVDGYHAALLAAQQVEDVHRSFFQSLLPGSHAQAIIVYEIAPFAALVFALLLLVLGLRRLPAAYSAWIAISLLVPLFYPTELRPLYSLHRFMLLVFPLFMVEAVITRRVGWIRWLLLGISAAALVYCTFAFAAFAPIG